MLCKFVAKQTLAFGITEYLVIPDLPPGKELKNLYAAIQLMIWRLRRDRPHLAAYRYEEGFTVIDADDALYIDQLPRITMVGANGMISVINVDQGDISPLLPQFEEDFVLLLEHEPVPSLPAWPDIITKSNCVLMKQSDEFIEIQTVDFKVMKLLESLPTL